MRELGATVLGVGLVDDVAASPTPLNLLPTEAARPAGRLGRDLAARVLAAAAAVLALAALVYPLWHKREAVIALHPRLDKARAGADVAERLGKEIEKLAAEHNFVLGEEARPGPRRDAHGGAVAAPPGHHLGPAARREVRREGARGPARRRDGLLVAADRGARALRHLRQRELQVAAHEGRHARHRALPAGRRGEAAAAAGSGAGGRAGGHRGRASAGPARCACAAASRDARRRSRDGHGHARVSPGARLGRRVPAAARPSAAKPAAPANRKGRTSPCAR